jgi:hypothetical protein
MFSLVDPLESGVPVDGKRLDRALYSVDMFLFRQVPLVEPVI